MNKPFEREYYLTATVEATQSVGLNHHSGEVTYGPVDVVQKTTEIFIYDKENNKEIGSVLAPTGDDTEDYDDIMMLIKRYEEGLKK